MAIVGNYGSSKDHAPARMDSSPQDAAAAAAAAGGGGHGVAAAVASAGGDCCSVCCCSSCYCPATDIDATSTELDEPRPGVLDGEPLRQEDEDAIQDEAMFAAARMPVEAVERPLAWPYSTSRFGALRPRFGRRFRMWRPSELRPYSAAAADAAAAAAPPRDSRRRHL